jgi:hypothetical protein
LNDFSDENMLQLFDLGHRPQKLQPFARDPMLWRFEKRAMAYRGWRAMLCPFLAQITH